jgi:uncharacterized protein (TIGR03118 family)
MHISLPTRRSRHWSGALVLAASAGLALAPSALAQSQPRATRHAVGSYAQRNLVADTTGKAELRDPDLVNSWGMSLTPTSPAWVSDFGTGRATLYSGAVAGSPVTKVPLTVTIPNGAPTGQVANTGTGFVVRSGSASGPARFLFASARGTITGWNPNVPGPNSTVAQTAITVPTASFTGLAKAGNRLFAADFHNARVDVWNSRFAPVRRSGAFRDRKIPAGYAPFGIQAAAGGIVVTYAKQDKAAQLDVPGAGHGFVDLFSTSGRLMRRIASRGPLNSPWGVTQAPAGFGAASGALLIGNFGDGRIEAYAPKSRRFLGQLGDAHGHTLAIPGLWALVPGNGVIGAHNALLFTAGPSQGTHGLFGELTATSTSTSTSTKGTTPATPTMPAPPTTPAPPMTPGY